MKLEPPPLRGRIIVDEGDLAALKFWIRVFELDPYIAMAQARIAEHAKATRSAVPVISEYHCGKLHWCYMLVLDVDSLGLTGGIGVVYYADQVHLDELRKSRDKLADQLINELHKRTESGQMLSEMALILPGEQK
jgi:hypothetical protein